MGNAAELIALMTPHGVRIGHVPGGIPSMTAQDVAGAMALCTSPFESALLLSRYAHDGQQFRAARVYWFERIMGEKFRAGWETQPGQCKGMADLTLDEWVGDNRCRVCKGVAEVMVDSKPVSCEACGGSGIRYVSDRRMSSALKIGRTAYANQWKVRVGWARQELLRIETGALGRLHTALKSR